MINTFVNFIKEREKVRVLKDSGKSGPWTADPYIGHWRFCNVDRCKDKETKWIFENIIDGHDSYVWFNLAIARFINWSPTLARLRYFEDWNPKRFISIMECIIADGDKAYTGAYMIRAGTGADAGKPKHEYLVDRVFNPLWKMRHSAPINDTSCAAWDEFYSKIFGMGDFMRNQIITDLKYSMLLPKRETTDWTTFCLAGPGTLRGLNRLMKKDTKEKINNPNAMLRTLRATVAPKIKSVFSYPVFDDLNNLSNCCCEFDKYMRLVEGTGTPRSRYP